jgi:hypothetical protein
LQNRSNCVNHSVLVENIEDSPRGFKGFRPT